MNDVNARVYSEPSDALALEAVNQLMPELVTGNPVKDAQIIAEKYVYYSCEIYKAMKTATIKYRDENQ